VLREWIEDGGARGVLAACGLLRGVPSEFFLERADFIQILLTRADAAGLAVLGTVQAMLYDVVGRVAAEGAEAGTAGGSWPPLAQIQEKGQALSADRGLHRLAREFYRELGRLAEERIQEARDSDEEQLI
jgi:hypothetical protein